MKSMKNIKSMKNYGNGNSNYSDEYGTTYQELPELIMMVGLPGSGKSTFAKKLARENGAVICSSDEIRREICNGDVRCQNKNDEVFKILHDRVEGNLRRNRNVIYDATNLYSRRRMDFLNEIATVPCIKKCLLMATPIKVCCERNISRKDKVPGSVIDSMYRKFCPPYWYEGWDMIGTQYPENFTPTKTVGQWLTEFAYFDLETKDHPLSLAKHGLATEDNLCRMFEGVTPTLRMAALIHDCGKPYTKTFIDGNGFMRKDAYYYNHHGVGAYDSLFFNYDSPEIDPLDVSILVKLHMEPEFWENNTRYDPKKYGELSEEYRELWGDQLHFNVMCLHAANVATRL